MPIDILGLVIPELTFLLKVQVRNRLAHMLGFSSYRFDTYISSEKSLKVLTEHIRSRSVVSGRLTGLLYEFGGLLLVEIRHTNAKHFFVTVFIILQVFRSFNLFKFLQATHSIGLIIATLMSRFDF